MTHTFIPSTDLYLLNTRSPQAEYEHLDYKNGRLVLIGEVFYQDICTACARLMNLLKAGKIKPKNIAFEYER